MKQSFLLPLLLATVFVSALAFQFRSKQIAPQVREMSFVYIGNEGQLVHGTLSGQQDVITQERNIRQFVIDGPRNLVWYLHQPGTTSPTQLWRYDLVTGKEERFLADKNFQIHSVRLAENGQSLVLITQPLLAKTNEALSVYRFLLSDETLHQIDLGELGLTLSDLEVSGDGKALVIKTLDENQYIREISNPATTTLEEVARYRGSDRLGKILAFENFNHDKNFAGEIILYDGSRREIVADDATLLMPSLSPNGEDLAYSFQLRNVFAEQSVEAGKALQVTFTLPVSGIRVQKTSDSAPEWERYESETSFELPKFSPNSQFISVEVFTKKQLQDLNNIRTYGEPNKPELGILRFFDRTGTLLPLELSGRELQWVDNPNAVTSK